MGVFRFWSKVMEEMVMRLRREGETRTEKRER
jgi:hypothetical protein